MIIHFYLLHFEVTGSKFAKELGLENCITMSGLIVLQLGM
jgi:hypothetical protein